MNASHVWRCVLADWRRLLLLYAAGWPGLALVLALTWLDSNQEGQHRLAKMLSPLYLAQIPMMIWTAGFMYGRSSRQRLTDALPLSVRELNLARMLGAGILLVAGAGSWFLTVALYRLRGEPFSIWLIVFAFLFFACYLFVSMRHVLVRAVPHVLIVALWAAEILLDFSTELDVMIWACGLLGPLTVLYAWRAISQSPPRWAR